MSEEKRAHHYEVDEEGDLVGHPEPAERHTPIRTLLDERGRLIGGRCQHCGLLLTPSGSVSEPFVIETKPPPKIRSNKSHERRAEAAANLLGGGFRGFLNDLFGRSDN